MKFTLEHGVSMLHPIVRQGLFFLQHYLNTKHSSLRSIFFSTRIQYKFLLNSVSSAVGTSISLKIKKRAMCRIFDIEKNIVNPKQLEINESQISKKSIGNRKSFKSEKNNWKLKYRWKSNEHRSNRNSSIVQSENRLTIFNIFIFQYIDLYIDKQYGPRIQLFQEKK